MSWQAEMKLILRSLVNDLDGTTYTDDVLEKTLAVAARQVGVEMEFPQNFVVTIGDTPAITPDPTDDVGQTRNDSYTNLVTIKAACIIDQGVATLAAKQAIAVGDGSSKIDLRERGITLLKMLAQGWCKTYDTAKLEYQSGLSQVAGAIVMTPFRMYAAGMVGERTQRTIMQY